MARLLTFLVFILLDSVMWVIDLCLSIPFVARDFVRWLKREWALAGKDTNCTPAGSAVPSGVTETSAEAQQARNKGEN